MAEMSSFEDFKTKIDLWKECLSGKDRNSIFNQIGAMIWHVGAFKVVNEARGLKEKDIHGNVLINPMISNLIDHYFFEGQLSAIRRLIDGYPLDGKNPVWSIVSLINDIKENRGMFTRANMFRVTGIEYNIEVAKVKERECMLSQSDEGSSCGALPLEICVHTVERKHKEIDLLTGSVPESRKPEDYLKDDILDQLIVRIKTVTKSAEKYVNKFIAHAAPPNDRLLDDVEQVKISFGSIMETQKIICQTAAFIDRYLISDTSHLGFLPVPQYDNFEYISEPLISVENVSKLHEIWKGYSRETEAWASWGLSDLGELLKNG